MSPHPAPTTELATDDEHARHEPDPWDDASLGSDGSLPARRKRRLLTPVTGGLAAIVLAAAGFAGGVEAQKHSQSSASAGAPGAGAGRAGSPGASGGGRPGTSSGSGTSASSSTMTSGTVSSKSGNVLYVKTSDGTVVRVRPTASATITRNATTTAKGIYPGDTVVIQGTTTSGGTIKASQLAAISATAATSSGPGLPGAGAASAQASSGSGGG